MGTEINKKGTQLWYDDVTGELHRDDGPAIVVPDGREYWYQHGQLHRDGGPALVDPDVKQEWYQYGKLHREDGPAIICSSGSQHWCLTGIEFTKEDYLDMLETLQH
jgi:hypothetical protein